MLQGYVLLLGACVYVSFKDSCIQQGIASGKVSHVLATKSNAGPQLQLPAKSTQPRKKKKKRSLDLTLKVHNLLNIQVFGSVYSLSTFK